VNRQRLAIGYSPEQLDRAIVVFFEMDDGVLLQAREEPAPRLIHQSPASSELQPGVPEFFNSVLDSFSTTYLIRTVRELEPDVLASMLTSDQVWDLLPRSEVPA
jgi:hypothetical protein